MMKMLVCDRDGSSRAVLRRLLMLAHKMDVSECASGAEALDLLAAGAFDALLLETDLPVLDGLDTVAILRETAELRHLPVVMVTSDRREESVRRAIALGVADYVLKPVRPLRLQVALRNVAATTVWTGRPAGVPESMATIDARTHVMIVDGDPDFREFFSGLLSPYCTLTQAASGASALLAASVSAPSVVFIGRGLGPVAAPALVRHLGKSISARFIKLSAPDEVDSDRALRAFDEVIGRTLVPDVMLGELKRFVIKNAGPLQQVLEHAPDLRTILIKSTASTFGMMLGQDVDVVEPGPDDIIGAHAIVEMVVAEQSALRIEIQCASELTHQLASATLGDEVDASAAAGVLGEIANVVTGRLQATLFERGVKCHCSLPQFGVGPAPPIAREDSSDRVVLEFAPVGTEARCRILVHAYSPTPPPA